MRPLILFAALAAVLPAQHSETALSNPFNTAADRLRGAGYFRSQCANCHGADAKGGASGPNLTTGSFRHAATDEGLFRVITKGIPGTSMPGFSMNGVEPWQIVAYLRTLQVVSAASTVRGDIQAGAQLYASLRCGNCHPSRAPNLAGIATRLSADEIRLALLDPSAAIAPEYWLWQGTTTDGQTIRGSRLNEDTYSLQILDASGHLRGISKSKLERQSLEQRSPMPSFRGKLTDQQLNHLLAYLAQ